MSYFSFLIDFIFNRLSMSSQINAYFGVDPENGSAKVGHGSGVIISLRAA
jgi:hypothetical protein